MFYMYNVAGVCSFLKFAVYYMTVRCYKVKTDRAKTSQGTYMYRTDYNFFPLYFIAEKMDNGST